MGLRDMIRAVQDYPAARAELETARSELDQTRQSLDQTKQALEQSEEDRLSMWYTSESQAEYLGVLALKAETLQDALVEFCPRLSTPEDLKRFYDAVSPSEDAQGSKLYDAARELAGIDVPSLFSYEESLGMFETMDGRQLLNWLIPAHFGAVEWTMLPHSCYEAATLLDVDTSTPEYRTFEKQLYEKALSEMGFQKLLASNQEPTISPPQIKKDRGDTR